MINKEKTYSYWFFYIKPEYLDLVYIEQDDSLLYAYTDNEKYYKLFSKRRDMNKFTIIKKKITKDVVNYLAKNFQREYLIKMKVRTRTRGIGSEIVDYNMIITNTEYNIVRSTAIQMTSVEIWKYTWINPFIFKDKYIDALEHLYYIDGYNMITESTKMNDRPFMCDIRSYIQPDFLSTFIHQYGFLLANYESQEGDDT